MIESDLQQNIMRELRKLGHHVVKTPAGLIRTEDGRMISIGTAGACDLTVSLRRPTFWESAFCEVKLPTGILSYKQILTLRDHEKNKRLWVVATCFNDVERMITDGRYHGQEKFIRPVFDMSYQPHEPKRRDKPTGLAGTRHAPYKELLDEKLSRERDELDRTLPF